MTNASEAAAPLNAATRAIARASAKTGAGFQYLLKTAMRESSLDAGARAGTSSAAGLFQFIEQTWLGAVRAYGARHGMAAQASAIVADANGGLAVADPEMRTAILDLRFDPDAAAAMAGELAAENATLLEARLGRTARPGDLYAAHFLGPANAVRLLTAPPDAIAADLVPAAAKANRAVFFDGDRARKAGEVVAGFEASMAGAGAPPRDPVAGAEAARPASRTFGKTPAGRGAAALSAATLSVLQALDPLEILRDGRKDRPSEQ